jgi:hypothetical protein
MKGQSTPYIMMVRPAHFGFNHETADSNVFQQNDTSRSEEEIHLTALAEFDRFVEVLRDHEIDVTVIDDTPDPVKTDAIFPNNWVTFHADGSAITYPMLSTNRRLERREEILDEKFLIERRYSFEYFEEEDKFLEGTGSMVFDHINNLVYASHSPRTNPEVLDKFCVLKDFRKVLFHSIDREGQSIYHTNVMMAIGTYLAVICLASISNESERRDVVHNLTSHGKDILELSFDQLNSFAGNMLELQSIAGQRYMIMSESALKSLSGNQIDMIESKTPIISCPIPTIETFGGGSVRCMMAEIFLSPK